MSFTDEQIKQMEIDCANVEYVIRIVAKKEDDGLFSAHVKGLPSSSTMADSENEVVYKILHYLADNFFEDDRVFVNVLLHEYIPNSDE